MKKLINFLSWLGVVCTILSIIITLLATYAWINVYSIGFLKLRCFHSYSALQASMFCTMLLWGIRLYSSNTGGRKFIYICICMLFAVSIIFLRFVGGVW
ncbi:hypothetical protein [Clostridium oryzae]|uniref:Uncharacterized protein n=1 Tax=Clostridium oryzae TaxID=1450648 RepID=A0A1V4IWI7_9CLOT|nr:hypothetical protein [Clostridium oryzae]OPJ64180.1 hypothetical protein CLORY_07450 [Clostridium oryzae]